MENKMKLKNIFADLKIYAKNYTRSGSAVFFVFIFPIILMLIFGSIFSGTGSSQVPLYVQNLDSGGSLSSQFLASLNETHVVTVNMIPSNVNIHTYISENSISDALLIPSNFTTSVEGGGAILVYYDNPAVSTSGIAQQAISFAVQAMNNRLSNTSSIVSLSVNTSLTTHTTGYVDYLMPGLIGFVVLISPMFSMTYVVSSYKRDKIFRQLSLTPLTKSDWFVSKFLWYLIVSALSAAEIVAIGAFVFNASMAINLFMAAFIVIGVFMFTSLGILAGAIARSEEGSSVIGNVITFPMMFLAGTFFPISIMPAWLQSFAHFLPLYYIIDGLNSVTLYTNYPAAWFDLAVSFVVAVVIFVMSIWKFNWKEE